MIRFAAAGAVIFALSAATARADVFQTYDLQYVNLFAAYGDPGLMTGVVTLDTTALPNPTPAGPTPNIFLPIGPYVSSLTLTVSDAPVGNGTYTLADYDVLVWYTIGTVDFDQNLVGQMSDFFFEASDYGEPGADTPTGFALLIMDAGDGGFKLVSAAPVPEPFSMAGFGAGLLGLAAIRGRRRAA